MIKVFLIIFKYLVESEGASNALSSLRISKYLTKHCGLCNSEENFIFKDDLIIVLYTNLNV